MGLPLRMVGTVQQPETRYARSDGLSIAYQVVGDGPLDVVLIPGFISHVDLNWELPPLAEALRRLSKVARVLVFDKRGTGLSDREFGHGTLEERMDDLRAVMDAARMERASIYGISEGGPISLLFAATFPERVERLALFGAFARIAWAPDYPEGTDRDTFAGLLDWIERRWGSGEVFGRFISHPDDPEAAARFLERFERYGCTPRVAREMMAHNYQIDVRAALPTVTAPTLVVHHRGDRVIPAPWGRYIADHLPNARYVALEGDFHASWRKGDLDPVLDLIEQHFTGSASATVPSERVLATVLFTDIAGSTGLAASLGDARWRALLDDHDAIVRAELARHRGREVKNTGDGFLAAFDGPARAIRCASAIIDRCGAMDLGVRAGIHTGECEQRDEDLSGMAVHLAARLVDLAGPRDLLVSQTVRDLVVGSGIGFDDRGTHDLRGVPGSWNILAVVEHAPAAP
jgi:class 3 adenylate cyclase/pimeloyl-ACP methyl ester carboxylesterase